MTIIIKIITITTIITIITITIIIIIIIMRITRNNTKIIRKKQSEFVPQKNNSRPDQQRAEQPFVSKRRKKITIKPN